MILRNDVTNLDKHFTNLPEIEPTLPDIEIDLLETEAYLPEVEQVGKMLVHICDIKCPKLGRFSFDISIPHCDNTTKAKQINGRTLQQSVLHLVDNCSLWRSRF